MSDISFNTACKELKIAQIAQLNQLFQLLHLAHIYGHCFYWVSRMLMSKNVNNDVSKDSPIKQGTGRKALRARLVLLTLCDFAVPLHRYVSINGLLKRLRRAKNDIFSKTNTKSRCPFVSFRFCDSPTISRETVYLVTVPPSKCCLSQSRRFTLSHIPPRVVQRRVRANPSCNSSVNQTYRLPGVTFTIVFVDAQL